MTDPTGGAPSPEAPIPPAPAPQAPVPPAPVAPAPPAPQAGGSWNAPPPTAAPGGFQTQAVAAEAGPAPGIVYADLMNRIIALVIDGVILWVINVVLIVIGGIFAVALGGLGLIMTLFFGLIYAFVSAIYFVYGWTRMRASFGQKFLNLETVNAGDGATLTQNQAIRRWAFLWGPFALAAIIPIVGFFLNFFAFLYALYLLYTTSQSPKRQGFHDLQAGTVVVKHL
jgi:uncharacterized RDD family membrane protein YckC